MRDLASKKQMEIKENIWCPSLISTHLYLITIPTLVLHTHTHSRLTHHTHSWLTLIHTHDLSTHTHDLYSSYIFMTHPHILMTHTLMTHTHNSHTLMTHLHTHDSFTHTHDSYTHTRLLFRRSGVQIPATTWWLTTICNKIWCPLLECLKIATVYLHIIINKSFLKIKKRKPHPYISV